MGERKKMGVGEERFVRGRGGSWVERRSIYTEGEALGPTLTDCG